MTTQQALDKMVAWFSRPNAVFGLTNDTCTYRGNMKPRSRVRCAVGCLVAPTAFAAHPTDRVITHPDFPWREWGLEGIDPAFLEEAQDLHDNMALDGTMTPVDFVEALKERAKRVYGLVAA